MERDDQIAVVLFTAAIVVAVGAVIAMARNRPGWGGFLMGLYAGLIAGAFLFVGRML